jgi:hypothetical protein
MSVSVRLVGRMGNQMFQVATAYAYAKRFDLEFIMPSQTIAPNVFPYYLNGLKVKRQGAAHTFSKVYKELSHRYHEIPFMPNVILDGYWQSAKYFDDQREAVLKLFEPILPWKPLEGYVGLHVRRGDYVQMADKHPPITYDYIREAVRHMNSLGLFSFIVCSDDLAWCKENFRGLEVYGNEFSYSHGNTPAEDMALLSCCTAQIISNSSFSWWSAYLNRNPDKVIIAPEVWFGPGNSHLQVDDLYLPGTIKLPS